MFVTMSVIFVNPVKYSVESPKLPGFCMASDGRHKLEQYRLPKLAFQRSLYEELGHSPIRYYRPLNLSKIVCGQPPEEYIVAQGLHCLAAYLRACIRNKKTLELG